jgi:hypothetical protein
LLTSQLFGDRKAAFLKELKSDSQNNRTEEAKPDKLVLDRIRFAESQETAFDSLGHAQGRVAKAVPEPNSNPVDRFNF